MVKVVVENERIPESLELNLRFTPIVSGWVIVSMKFLDTVLILLLICTKKVFKENYSRIDQVKLLEN